MINFLRLGRSRPAARPRSASPNLVGAGGLALSSSLRRARTAGQVMITGVVRAREARIQLRIRGPRRREQEVEAVLDTGYTAWLTLPPTLVAALCLRWNGVGRGILADGSMCLFDVYEATVMWDRRALRVLV